MQKLLSIVVPTYNMEKYLPRCLDSLLLSEDEMSKMEVLVINDGSRDSSLQIAQEYENLYPQTFRVIDKENGNYGSCVNRGIEEATGKYFRILDADDWFDTKALSTYLHYLENIEDTDVVVTNYSKQYVGGRYAQFNFKNVVPNIVIKDFNFKTSGNLSHVCMHALTYRIEFLRNIGLNLQTGISYTDTEYCYFPIIYATTFVFLDVNLYQYLIGREGQTVSKEAIIRNQDNFYKVAKRILSDYISNKMPMPQGDSLERLFIDIVYNIYKYNLVLKNGNNDNQLFEIEDLVKKIPFLYKATGKVTYKKVPFVKIWRLTKFRVKYLFLIK